MTDSSKHRPTPDSAEDRADESPLCLESDGVVRPILQLSETGFSVPPSQGRTELEQPHQSQDFQTGLLFTENGEVSIPVQFRVVSSNRHLTSCCWGTLAPDANRELQDLLDFLACDWDEKPSTAVDAADAVPRVGAARPVVDSHTAATRSPATDSGRGSFWRRKASGDRKLFIRRRRLLVCAIAAIILMIGLPLGYQTLVADKSRVASTAKAATSAAAAAETSMLSQTTPAQAARRNPASVPTKSPSGYTTIIPPSERWLTASEPGIVVSIAVARGDSVVRGESVMVTKTGTSGEIDPALAVAMQTAEEKSQQLRNQLAAIARSTSETTWTASDVERVGDQLRQAISNRDQSLQRWEQMQPLVRNQNIPRNEVEQARAELADAESTVRRLRTSWEELTQRGETNAKISDPDPSQEANRTALASTLLSFEQEIDRLRQTLARTLESASMKPITTSQSGVVAEIPVAIGQRVEFGEPLIAIASQQPVSLEFMVDSHVAAKFTDSETARMRIGDSDRIVEGRVTSTMDIAALDDVQRHQSVLVPLVVQIESQTVASDRGMSVHLIIPDNDAQP